MFLIYVDFFITVSNLAQTFPPMSDFAKVFYYRRRAMPQTINEQTGAYLVVKYFLQQLTSLK